MAWIESHQALGHHPKTLRLASLLKCSVPTAVGYCQFLWWWALDYAPDGVVPIDAKAVAASACLWRGKPETFWKGLLESGFVEETDSSEQLRIHDWMVYAGSYVKKRRDDAERKRRERSAGRMVDSPVENAGPSNGQTTDVRANQPYQPYQPENNQPDQDIPPGPPSDRPKGGEGLETCPECEMPVDAKGEGHGLTRHPGRIRNCSLDHQAPYEWPDLVAQVT
jgi:hypothetical protein